MLAFPVFGGVVVACGLPAAHRVAPASGVGLAGDVVVGAREAARTDAEAASAGSAPHGLPPPRASASAVRAAPAPTAPPRLEDPWQTFRRRLVDLVNRDRRAAGLAYLAPRPDAMAFAQAEAERLVRAEAFGHHDRDGTKPYQRWARRGGRDHVRENLFRLTLRDRRAYMAFDPGRAQARLMASRGHRENILDPAHTALGVGIAYDRRRNSVYVVQEFVNAYLELDPDLETWRAGEPREIRGRLASEAGVALRGAALFREPVPGSAAAASEARRRSYRESGEPALVLDARAFAWDPATGEFRLRIELPAAAAPGPYTLVVYVGRAQGVGSRGRGRTAQAVPAALACYEVVR